MLQGKDVARQISGRLAAAEQQVLQASRHLQALRAQQEGVRADEARTIAALAKVRLGELDAERIAEGLDAADHAALELLGDRDREAARVRDALAAGARDLAALDAEHGELLRARDVAAAARDAQIAATMQRLGEDEAYAVQRAHVAACVEKAGNADEKAAQSEADRDRKRVPFETDKLFAYLWRRRYRFPEYRALPLIRALDDWVARLCDYDRAHRDYGLLLAIPERLRAHATSLATTAAAEAAKLEALEAEALRADGLPALDDELQRTERLVQECEARHAAAERVQQELFAQEAAIAAGRDEYTVRAAAALDAQLGREDVATLRADAARTATAQDDELVQRIAALRRREDELDEQIRDAAAAHEAAQRARSDVQEVSSRFRREGFDGDDSLFDGIDVPTLLGRLLSGALRSHDAWSVLRGGHRRRPRPTPTIFGSGGFGGGFGGGRIGGGFKIGGGFGGGGGFRTGGGFGGGGGFRTGGRF